MTNVHESQPAPREEGSHLAVLAPVAPEGVPNYLPEVVFDLQRQPLPRGVVYEEAVVPMRDGVRLAASVYRPVTSEPVPVITTATPYGKDRFDQWDTFGPKGSVPGGRFYMGHVKVSDRTAFEAPDPGFWVPNGYAVMLIDLPGLGDSGFAGDAAPPHQERWYDAMAWLEQQPWCTGAVGLSGVSALCATQWVAAQDPAPPQLKAIIAWEGFNETGPGGGYGGIPETVFPAWLGTEWIEPNINPDAEGPKPFLFGWEYHTAAIGIPALVCASFSDQELHTWDTFEAFIRLHSSEKWLYNHRRQKWGAYYGEPELALQKRFLDRFLKGDERTMDNTARVRLEVNDNRFDYKIIEADQWPPASTRYQELYLDGRTGRLRHDPTPEAETMTFAPEPEGDNDNRAVFDYQFDRDTDLVGHMALRVFVEGVDTDNVDLFVGVEKLDAAGNEVYFFSASGGNANGPVTRGWLRASKRKLDPARSTDWRPVPILSNDEPLRPREVVEANVPLMPSGTSFHAGETLRLVI